MATAGPWPIPHPKLDAGVRSRAENAQPPGAAVRQGIGSSGSSQPLPGLDRIHHLSDHLLKGNDREFKDGIGGFPGLYSLRPVLAAEYHFGCLREQSFLGRANC